MTYSVTLLGFLITILGIFISMDNRGRIILLKDRDDYHLLFDYFIFSIIAHMLLCLISMFGLFNYKLLCLDYIFVFCLSLAIISMIYDINFIYRFIHISLIED